MSERPLSIKERIAAMKLDKGDPTSGEPQRPRTVPRNFKLAKNGTSDKPASPKPATLPKPDFSLNRQPKAVEKGPGEDKEKIPGSAKASVDESSSDTKPSEEPSSPQVKKEVEQPVKKAEDPPRPSKTTVTPAAEAEPIAPAEIDSPKLDGRKLEMRLSFSKLHPDLVNEDSPRNRAKSSGANPSALARSRSQKLEQMALLKNSQENAEGVVSKAAEKVKVEELKDKKEDPPKQSVADRIASMKLKSAEEDKAKKAAAVKPLVPSATDSSPKQSIADRIASMKQKSADEDKAKKKAAVASPPSTDSPRKHSIAERIASIKQKSADADKAKVEKKDVPKALKKKEPKEEPKPAAKVVKKEEPKVVKKEGLKAVKKEELEAVKKGEPKKEEPKKEEPKKEEPKKEEPKPAAKVEKKEEPAVVKKEEPKKEEPKPAAKVEKKEELKQAPATPKSSPKSSLKSSSKPAPPKSSPRVSSTKKLTKRQPLVVDRIASMKKMPAGDVTTRPASTPAARSTLSFAERITTMEKSADADDASSRPVSTATASSASSSSVADRIAAMKKKSDEASKAPAPSPAENASTSFTAPSGSIADRIAKMKSNAGGMEIKLGKRPPTADRPTSIESTSSASTNGIMNPDEPPKPRKRSITVTKIPKIPFKVGDDSEEPPRTSDISEGDERDSDSSRTSSLTASIRGSPQVRTLKKIQGDKDPNMHVIDDERISVGSNSSSVKSSATGKISALAGKLGGLDMKAMLGGPRGPLKGGVGMPGMMAMPGMTAGVPPPALMKKRFEFNIQDDGKAGELQHATASRAVMKKKRKPKSKGKKLMTESLVESVGSKPAKSPKKIGFFGAKKS